MELQEYRYRLVSDRGSMERMTKANKNFRKVVYTDANMQVVLYALLPGENIGMEHHLNSQFVRVEQGEVKVISPTNSFSLTAEDWTVIPPQTQHDLANSSESTPAKFYVVYSPPAHPAELVQEKKPRENHH